MKQRIMIYRRTHTGDPNQEGVFGCNDCMKSFRNRSYDAVVGIGGLKPDSGCEDIAKKINWVGIGPTKINPDSYDPKKLDPESYELKKFDSSEKRFKGLWVIFDNFLLLDDQGPYLEEIAPRLYEYIFEKKGIIRNPGYCPVELYDEVANKILSLAAKAPPSKGPIQIARENVTAYENITRSCKTAAVKVANCGCKE